MALRLTGGLVLLEETEERTPAGLYTPGDKSGTVRTKVIATGPGWVTHDGTQHPMPCKPGDTVIVSATAGGPSSHLRRFGPLENVWLVYADRGDIYAVEEADD